MRSLLVLLSCALFASAAMAQATQPVQKKLIEFGWDEPDTAFMRKHIAEMEKSPFDGTVFHVMYAKPDGTPGHFIWEGWSKRAFTEAELAQAIDDLRNTPFTKFTHNFLRFNTTPAEVDWFDDAAYTAIAGNARLMAKIAKEGNAAGILFDIEQYNAQLFSYAKQHDAGTKSYAQYAEQAERRGRQVMEAFQSGYPDLTILMTWSYSLPYLQAGNDPAKRATADYGLMKPFLDGMFIATTGKTKVVDGYESSYSYKDARQFDDARTLMTQAVPTMLGDALRERYKSVGSVGFGLWMDYDWRNKAWDEKDFTRNHFTPDQFQSSVRKAMETADEYVWIYTETPRWWTAAGGRPDKLPAEYDRAVRRGAGR